MIRHIYWKDAALFVLDQRELPRRTRYLRCPDPASVSRAIRDMALRGAPLIGGAAAYGFALAAKSLPKDPGGRARRLSEAAERLKASRPTAVNLAHAVDRMQARARKLLAREPRIKPAGLLAALKAEADSFFREDEAANRRMAELGAALLPPGSVVITYCNTGRLATCGWGTAFGVIRRAHELGRVRRVYACETRPYLQGSRLTLWELMRAKIPCELITDNMAAHIMATAGVRAVLVGADRIAANGDVANKIGTYGLAILARHHGVPLYVAAPSTTVDLAVPDGRSIPIEERDPREVVELRGVPIAPRGAKARHPAFDVTPRELVAAIITERGVVRPVDGPRLAAVLGAAAP